MKLQSSVPSLQVCQSAYYHITRMTQFQVANPATGQANAPQAAIDGLDVRQDQQQNAMSQIRCITAIVCVLIFRCDF